MLWLTRLLQRIQIIYKNKLWAHRLLQLHVLIKRNQFLILSRPTSINQIITIRYVEETSMAAASAKLEETVDSQAST